MIHWDEKMLANYLVHIYKCDAICLRTGFGTEVMFLTESELADAIIASHVDD